MGRGGNETFQVVHLSKMARTFGTVVRDLQHVSPAMSGVNLTHSKNANSTSGKGKQLKHMLR